MKVIYLLCQDIYGEDDVMMAFEEKADVEKRMQDLVEADKAEGWVATYSKDKVYCYLTKPNTELAYRYHYILAPVYQRKEKKNENHLLTLADNR